MYAFRNTNKFSFVECVKRICHRNPKSFVTPLSAKIKISDIDIVEGEENTFFPPASIQEVVKSAHPWKKTQKKPNTVLHKDPFVKEQVLFYAMLRLSAPAGKTKGGDPMLKLPTLFRKDWAFFLNDRGRKSYNEICLHCMRKCKQSFRAVILNCPKYISKRSEKQNDVRAKRTADRS